MRDIWGRLWSAHSPERVVDDIEYLKRTYDIAGVYFREDIFTVFLRSLPQHQRRTTQLCTGLALTAQEVTAVFTGIAGRRHSAEGAFREAYDAGPAGGGR